MNWKYARALGIVLVVGLALAVLLTPPATPPPGGGLAQEQAMQDYVYRYELDDDAFPEHAFGPGAIGIFAELQPAGADRRIPSERNADLSLLVVFRLPDEASADAVWRLEVERREAGETRVLRFDLVDAPADGNVTETVRPPANVQLPPGMIYRGAFWADVSGLLRSGILSSASAARVTYANQSAVLRVPVPAAAAD